VSDYLVCSNVYSSMWGMSGCGGVLSEAGPYCHCFSVKTVCGMGPDGAAASGG
jgi:hypothetical protein